MAETFIKKFTRCAKVCGFFLDCAFRSLIGWEDKHRSHGIHEKIVTKTI